MSGPSTSTGHHMGYDHVDDNSDSHAQLATPLSLSPVSDHGTSTVQQQPPHMSVQGRAQESDISIVIPARPTLKPETDMTIEQPTPVRLDQPQVLKLSPAQLHELTTSPESVPIRKEDTLRSIDGPVSAQASRAPSPRTVRRQPIAQNKSFETSVTPVEVRSRPVLGRTASSPVRSRRSTVSGQRHGPVGLETPSRRPTLDVKIDRAISPSPAISSVSSRRSSPPVSPALNALPLPPMSLPTYLHLELSADRPSPLFIHRAAGYDIPYESAAVKFERLLNFLLLPHQLEQVLLFGTLACLDAWLYTFTILPMRFARAVCLLVRWWLRSLRVEVRDLASFVHAGLGRLWNRQVMRPDDRPSPKIKQEAQPDAFQGHISLQPADRHGDILRSTPRRSSRMYSHRRTRSQPSALLPNHKADILHGLLIIISCMILVRFDASRMYHSIRGQAAIKLYVIYNVLEVGDRLFSALGQDVLECLFSKETLERKPNGRSKVIRPFWMFILALVYNVIHATMLFYQVVTLNVAVNSYSNALLTLLMSNQFVEIRGTVFKKFEKENLFQMVCADVVERFQLWLMLLIIALRNIAEAGGLSIGGALGGISSSATGSMLGTNATGAPAQVASILPKAFTLVPRFTGQVLAPFLVVLGSEMLVDWVKHAYINKFNRVKPTLYGRFLDVLAKDYYTHAFADQNLTKRIGLPVLPLSCLFIRAAAQTYHMFLATHVPPPPLSSSTATSTAVDSVVRESSAATTAALAQIDNIIRRALGSSSFGGGAAGGRSSSWSWLWSLDDLIALTTMVLFFSVLYLFLLALKLVLGMTLLRFARSRYAGMKAREEAVHETDSRRVGPWGAVEMSNDTKRYINGDETKSATEGRKHSAGGKSRERVPLDGVGRYMMVAKRIW